MNFLPGWSPGLMMAKRVTSLSFVDSATSTGASVTGPAGIESGDLLVLFDKAETKGSPPSFVTPSGFTLISDLAGSGVSAMVTYKIADGSEASASITGMDGGSSDNKILAVFRGNVAITSVAVNDLNEEMTQGNPTAQVVNASGGSAPLIVIGCYGTSDGASSSISPRTWTGGTPSELSSGTHTYMLYEIFDSSPADITTDMDDEGQDNSLQSFWLEVS